MDGDDLATRTGGRGLSGPDLCQPSARAHEPPARGIGKAATRLPSRCSKGTAWILGAYRVREIVHISEYIRILCPLMWPYCLGWAE